jgi:hypothetical protein
MKRVPRFRFLALTGAALLLAGTFTPAAAQADPDDVKRGVARISLMDGDVSVRRGDSGDWVAGVVNAPLLTGDQVATAANSRAEVQLDAANALRLGGDASVHIAQLEYDRYQLEIARGTVTYRVLRPTDVNIEVDTQNLSVRPSKQGIYRIRVDDAGESEITVRAGSVEVSTASGSQWVNAGQTMKARGSAADPEFQIVAAIPADDWDRWNESRDAVELNSPSNQYVPQGVYGAEDLDRYGTWSSVPDYGNVWQPTVAADWSPYSQGQWTWEDWYGWTWVSADPWGWAPYHYGRWFHRDNFGWAWYPGARFGRHYWSPALVGFFGWGGAGFGMGNIGWVPLAPYEALRPWWGRSYYGRSGYMNRNINISTVGITNIYRNAGVMNGINGVRGADFQGGRFQGITHYTGSQIRDARVVQGGMPIAPGAANLRFSERQAAAAPRAAANTHFFSREQPAAVERIPFAQQQRAFQEARPGNGGGTGRDVSSPRAAGPAQGEMRQGAQAQQQPAQAGGWRRFGDRPGQDAAPPVNRNTPAQSNTQSSQNPAARTNETPAQQNRSGWQRFGAPGTETETAPPRNPETQSAPQAGWNRFGSPGTTPSQPRQQTPPPAYRSNPAPSYRAPQYSPAPAPRQSAPQSSPPAASRQSAPRSSGGGGSARGSSSSSGSRGGHGR